MNDKFKHIKENLMPMADYFDMRWEEVLRFHVMGIVNERGLHPHLNQHSNEIIELQELVKLHNPIYRMMCDYTPKTPSIRGGKKIIPSPSQVKCAWAIWDAMAGNLFYDERIGYNTERMGWQVTEIVINTHRQWGKTEIAASTFSSHLQSMAKTETPYHIISIAPTLHQNYISEHVARHLIIDAQNTHPAIPTIPSATHSSRIPPNKITMQNGNVSYSFSTTLKNKSIDCVHVDEMQLLSDDRFNTLIDNSSIGLLLCAGSLKVYDGCTMFSNKVTASRNSIKDTGHPLKGTFYMEVDCYKSLTEATMSEDSIQSRKSRNPVEFAINYELKGANK